MELKKLIDISIDDIKQYLYAEIIYGTTVYADYDERLNNISEEDISYIFNLLNGIKSKKINRYIRKVIGIPLEYIPLWLRQVITNILKFIRNPKQEFPIKDEIKFFICDQFNFKFTGKVKIGVTFDIDNQNDYKNLSRFVELFNKNGMKITINLLTHGKYKIDRDFILELNKTGNEIGLHGDIHDIGFAYRKKAHIKKRLLKSLDSLPVRPFGYRSPALSISYNLLSVLEELGFKYDSSLSIASKIYKDVNYPYMYKFYNHSLIEIPLFLQDDYFFREAKLSDKEALNIFKDRISQIFRYNPLIILNFHPGLSTKHLYFINGVLEYLNSINTKIENKILINFVKQYLSRRI